MKYFTEVSDLPIYDLHSELEKMLKDKKVHFSDSVNQICLNTTPDTPDDYLLGCGSLVFDWDNKIEEKQPDGKIKVKPVRYKTPYTEEQFNILANPFKNTLFEDVYNKLQEKYVLGRVRIMNLDSRKVMTWHVDTSKRLHYPLTTQEGCMMVIEDEVKFMPQYTWWLTDTTKYHTAFNSSPSERLHLVAVILDVR